MSNGFELTYMCFDYAYWYDADSDTTGAEIQNNHTGKILKVVLSSDWSQTGPVNQVAEYCSTELTPSGSILSSCENVES